MLVLSHYKGEVITIGTYKVKVMSCDKGRVRLSYDVPKDVKILRGGLEPDEWQEGAA